jgi:hypothetical protein
MFYRKRERAEVYNDVWIDIVISDDVKRINKEFKGSERDWYATVFRHNFRINPEDVHKKRSVVVVLNPNNQFGIIDDTIIVHEAVHMKNKIFMIHGVKNDVRNDEHEAYFVEYLYKKIKTFFDEVIEKEKEIKIVETKT